MIDVNQFKMDAGEERVLAELLDRVQPRQVAEFGSGLTTRFWATRSDARIVTWDNYEDWIAKLRATFAGEPWIRRVEWRHYIVIPEGSRAVEKEPVPWQGDAFDFVFIDGPRSAHAPNFGRSGSFRFATRHTREGGLIVWHDAHRPHERQMARRYLGHCRRSRIGTLGWCSWEPKGGGVRQLVNRLNPAT